MNLATDKQRAFLVRLRDERELDAERTARLSARIEDPTLTKAEASIFIDWMTQQPMKAGIVPSGSGLDLTGVPAGHYAVGDALFRIDAPEAGRWAGWVFVKNGSEYHEEEKYGSQRPGGTYFGAHADLLAVIVDDPIAAAKHYGQITGRCAICHRPLEDEVSVARGIGPICWERVA